MGENADKNELDKRDVIAECCQIWNGLKFKSEMVDILAESKLAIIERDREIERLKEQVKFHIDTHTYRFYLDRDKEYVCDFNVSDAMMTVFNSNKIDFAIGKLRDLQDTLNAEGDPVDIGVLGVIEREIKNLEALKNE